MSERQSIEKQTYDQFIEKLKAGDDVGAKDLLVGKFGNGSDYAGESLLFYVYEHFDLVLVMFKAGHYRCEQTFEEIKAKLSVLAEEDGCHHLLSATEIYFVQVDQMSNLGDVALADKIASGMIPDLWPIPGDLNSFGIPSRSTWDISFDTNKVIFAEVQNLSLLKETSLEVLVKVDVATNGAGDLSGERLSPEEFGDRSRNPEMMTLVYNLESDPDPGSTPPLYIPDPDWDLKSK
ncbi:MAG: hypothetical protein H8E96_03415 [Verrucomicrobiaceae bacterium]|nr:hypothetical protein [Verrucomicrobiaceae bacterium]